MQIQNKHIVNTLFVLGFPLYGIGKYVAQVSNYSLGQFISVFAFLLIVCFYVLEAARRGKAYMPVKPNIIFLVLFFLMSSGAFIHAYRIGVPGLNYINVSMLILFCLLTMVTPLIVLFYNGSKPRRLQYLLAIGLGIDILVNVTGYILGFRNAIHSIEGRINLPFGQGLYATANTVAIFNLLVLGIIFYIKNKRIPNLLLWLIVFVNIYLMLQFNSRLSMLIFLLSLGFILTRLYKLHKTVFILSLFTIPILLSTSDQIYKVLQLPGFSSILKRVSYEDITGFNGRRDIWEKGIEWLTSQGEGFLEGNGYRGHYSIDLLSELEYFWDKTTINMHMHSSMLEYALSIGVSGLFVLLVIMFLGFRQVVLEKHVLLIGPFIYLLFLFQVDNFPYILNYGALIIFTLSSFAFVKTTKNHVKYHLSENFDRDPFIQPGEVSGASNSKRERAELPEL